MNRVWTCCYDTNSQNQRLHLDKINGCPYQPMELTGNKQAGILSFHGSSTHKYSAQLTPAYGCSTSKQPWSPKQDPRGGILPVPVPSRCRCRGQGPRESLALNTLQQSWKLPDWLTEAEVPCCSCSASHHRVFSFPSFSPNRRFIAASRSLFTTAGQMFEGRHNLFSHKSPYH